MTRYLLHAGKDHFAPTRFEGKSVAEVYDIIGGNTGNLLFAHSMYKYLLASEDTVLDSNFYSFHRETPVDADRINADYDAVVIPASNWLSGQMAENLPVMASHIRRLKIPCVVIGLGAQSSWDYDKGFLDAIREPALEFLAAVSERSATIGVRGQFTAECLETLGFNNARVIGCPSFFLHGENFSLEKKEVAKDSLRFVVNAPPAVLEESFGRFLETGGEFIAQGDDIELKAFLQPEELTDRDCLRLLELGALLRLKFSGRARMFSDVRPWMEYLRGFDFCFGTRIHGNIIAILSRVPALVLTQDSRTREIAEFLRIPHRRLSSLQEAASACRLFEEYDPSAMNAAYPGNFRNFVEFLEENSLENIFQEGGRTDLFEKRLDTLQCESYEAGNDGLVDRLRRDLRDALAARKELKRVYGSTSWKLTAPLRKLAGLFRTEDGP